MRAFQPEDYLLAALLGLESFVAPWLDPTAAFGPNGWPSPLGWVVLIAFLIVFVSRGPGDADLDTSLFRRMFMLGPLLFVFSILAPLTNFVVHQVRVARARRRRTFAPEPWRGWPGPPLPDGLRRVLALPFTVMGESVFRHSVGVEIDLWLGGRELSDLPPFLFFALCTLTASYGFLVVGPRVIAGAELAWWPWLLRFALFVTAWAAGGGLGTL